LLWWGQKSQKYGFLQVRTFGEGKAVLESSFNPGGKDQLEPLKLWAIKCYVVKYFECNLIKDFV